MCQSRAHILSLTNKNVNGVWKREKYFPLKKTQERYKERVHIYEICFSRGVGLDDPQRSLPTPNIL